MRRRTFLRTSGLSLLACSAKLSRAANSATVEEAFDEEMAAFMQPRGVPGGAVAVVKNRRLVLAKGYGWADRERKIAVEAESLFRIASISKTITAVAVLQLVESGRLELDARAFEVLGMNLAKGADARLALITVRQLLHHTGGWDRAKSFDPMFRAREIAKSFDLPSPARPEAVIRYMLGQRLDTDPGSAYAYSNFGYCVLGRIIEKLTGIPYDAYVKEKVLVPAGIHAMRIGASLRAGQAPGEVCYYTPKESTGPSVFDGPPNRVPTPYGGFHLEAMDAHGGWIASVVDLVRFATLLDDPAHSPLLRRETFDLLYSPPAAPVSHKDDGALADHYYACGWDVRPVGSAGRANYWHSGSLPGTSTLLVRRHDGLTWAVCFNQRSDNKKQPDGAIDAALHRAANRVGTWPEGTAL
jgi:CubicO group peptidase (beta-lactamase class C family)